jgi:hypothetical protein
VDSNAGLDKPIIKQWTSASTTRPISGLIDNRHLALQTYLGDLEYSVTCSQALIKALPLTDIDVWDNFTNYFEPLPPKSAWLKARKYGNMSIVVVLLTSMILIYYHRDWRSIYAASRSRFIGIAFDREPKGIPARLVFP